MKPIAYALLLAGSVLASTAAYADRADAQWVARCVSDNQRGNATVEQIAKYCTCLNGKMDDNETLSVTAWEKSHPTEMKMCERESGWQ